MRAFLVIALLSVSIVGLSVCDPSEDKGSDVELLSGSEVTIDVSLKHCSDHSSCTLVWTGCDGCCQRQAINKAFVGLYQEKFREACTDYSGPVCHCIPADQIALCVNQKCEAVATSH